ncbi:hypothetical protein [Trichococcus patagoniensis]|uniref:hypothetical protein n=1 Tax=Trichococcus patagoniensis TaxID=382641 RepID=UPI000D3B6879|nr:hypothetical protein [Trichococcus patagoniensis]
MNKAIEQNIALVLTGKSESAKQACCGRLVDSGPNRLRDQNDLELDNRFAVFAKRMGAISATVAVDNFEMTPELRAEIGLISFTPERVTGRSEKSLLSPKKQSEHPR